MQFAFGRGAFWQVSCGMLLQSTLVRDGGAANSGAMFAPVGCGGAPVQEIATMK
jgi:hypothetical protein